MLRITKVLDVKPPQISSEPVGNTGRCRMDVHSFQMTESNGAALLCWQGDCILVD